MKIYFLWVLVMGALCWSAEVPALEEPEGKKGKKLIQVPNPLYNPQSACRGTVFSFEYWRKPDQDDQRRFFGKDIIIQPSEREKNSRKD